MDTPVLLRLKPGQAETKCGELVSLQPHIECWGLGHWSIGAQVARLPVVELHDPIRGTRRLALCIKAQDPNATLIGGTCRKAGRSEAAVLEFPRVER